MNSRIKRRLLDGQIPLWVMALLINVPVFAGGADDRWWPTQAFPKSRGSRRQTNNNFRNYVSRLQMMVQSVAGLAAKSVNQDQGDELVWVSNGDGDLEKWYTRLLAKHPGLATPGSYDPWGLVDRYTKRGIIKGYILYRSDKSKGENNAEQTGHELLNQHRHAVWPEYWTALSWTRIWRKRRKHTALSCCWMSARKHNYGVFKPTRISSTIGFFASKIREYPTSVIWPSRKGFHGLWQWRADQAGNGVAGTALTYSRRELR